MKTIERTDITGKVVKFLIPENDKDLEAIRDMDDTGQADTDESFADAPLSLPLEDQDEENGAPDRSGGVIPGI